jgi:integrase
VLLWRAGLRINEALSLTKSDLDPARGSIRIRRGKGGRRRQVGMDPRGWEHLSQWLEVRLAMQMRSVAPSHEPRPSTRGGQSGAWSAR